MKFNSFDIIWIEICTYPAGSSIQAHSHEFYHFIYVDSGEGFITVDGKEYPMTSGRLFPIPIGAEHTFYNSGEEPLMTLELKFALHSHDERRRIADFPICMETGGYPVKNGLLNIYRESHTPQTLSAEIMALYFNLIMTYLLRCCDKMGGQPEAKKNSASPEIERATAYIRDNFTREMPLDELAEIAGFEKNYFLRKFKKQTGCTPMVYILNKRIEKAKELLSFSDMNVTQIAAATGFKSVHYFSKVFYDHVKVRPSEWRRNQQ